MRTLLLPLLSFILCFVAFGAPAAADDCERAAVPKPFKEWPIGPQNVLTPCFFADGTSAGDFHCATHTWKARQDYHQQCAEGTDEAWCKCCKPKPDQYTVDEHHTTCTSDSDGNKKCVAGASTGNVGLKHGGETHECEREGETCLNECP